MNFQILAIVALAASAHAGLSYSAGGNLGGLGHGGGLIGLGGASLGGLGHGGGLVGLGGLGLSGGGLAVSSHGVALGGHAIAAAPVAVHAHQPVQTVVDYYTPAHYDFKYGVNDPHTGDRKEQSETRVGDTVKGQYSLAEPDGTIRVVKYTADAHNGFNAIVSRIGHAAHPQVVAKAVVPVAAHGIGISSGLVHGGGLIHGAGLVHGGALVNGGGLVHGGALVHGGGLVQGGSVVHGASVVHGGSLTHGGIGVISH